MAMNPVNLMQTKTIMSYLNTVPITLVLGTALGTGFIYAVNNGRRCASAPTD